MALLDIIYIPFGYVIKFCYAITNNYVFALLLFAIVVKVVLFPLGIKQQKNQVKQASLKPKEAAIRKRYAGRTDKATQQKVQQEILDLYQKENFNPMGGCLPLLLQLPIIMALYQIIRNPLRYISSLSNETITQVATKLKELLPDVITSNQVSQITLINNIRSLSESDYSSLVQAVPELDNVVLPNLTAFGMDLTAKPNLANPSWLLLIPVITFVVSYFSMKITKRFTYQSQATANAGASGKIMDFAMPAMSVYFTFILEATIGVYWIFQNLLSLLQTILLAKLMPLPKFTDDDFKAAEKEYNVRPRKKEKTKVRSLHRIDEEDDEDEQQESDFETDTDTDVEQPEQDTTDTPRIAPAPLKKDPPKNKKKKK